MQETQVWSLGQEDPLEEGMATRSSILAWRIPRTEEPGGLQSMGLQRFWHNWATDTIQCPSGQGWVRYKEITRATLEGLFLKVWGLETSAGVPQTLREPEKLSWCRACRGRPPKRAVGWSGSMRLAQMFLEPGCLEFPRPLHVGVAKLKIRACRSPVLAKPGASKWLVDLCCLLVRGSPQCVWELGTSPTRAQDPPRYVRNLDLRIRAWWGRSIWLKVSEFGVFAYPATPVPLGSKEAPSSHNSPGLLQPALWGSEAVRCGEVMHSNLQI